MNTIVRIALWSRPDGRTAQHTRIHLRGHLTPTEALTRAYTHVHNDRSVDRDYLLNCLDIGNFSITTEAA